MLGILSGILIITLLILINEYTELKIEYKKVYHNYKTAMLVLSKYDPKLKEFLEREED